MLLEQTKIWAVTLSDGEGTEPVMLGASINAEEHYENYPGVARDGWICCMSWRDNTVCKTDIHLSGNPDGTNFFPLPIVKTILAG
jgi:hypothetical protein